MKETKEATPVKEEVSDSEPNGFLDDEIVEVTDPELNVNAIQSSMSSRFRDGRTLEPLIDALTSSKR